MKTLTFMDKVHYKDDNYYVAVIDADGLVRLRATDTIVTDKYTGLPNRKEVWVTKDEAINNLIKE